MEGCAPPVRYPSQSVDDQDGSDIEPGVIESPALLTAAARTAQACFSADRPEVRESAYQMFGKRCFDLVFSAVFLLCFGSWLLPLIALAIKIDSRGPVFFRQRRVGMHGEPFICLKFRTMVHRPEADFVQAQKDDHRITRIGRLLRSTNLDEIPQFINVFFGEMSVIGPRPHVPELDAMFVDLVPNYRWRTTVKPGVSGLAQISGCRGETRSVREMKHRIRFDMFYCRNMGLILDLKLVCLTVLRALAGDEKAY